MVHPTLPALTAFTLLHFYEIQYQPHQHSAIGIPQLLTGQTFIAVSSGSRTNLLCLKQANPSRALLMRTSLRPYCRSRMLHRRKETLPIQERVAELMSTCPHTLITPTLQGMFSHIVKMTDLFICTNMEHCVQINDHLISEQ